MHHIDDRRDVPAAQPAEEGVQRARAVRATLPGQVGRERVQTARATYGPLYTRDEAQRRIGESLPRKLGHLRSAVLEPIEEYGDHIPDEALLKYDEAHASGLFARFWVATPTYLRDRQVDPWILGEVAGAPLYAIIARWD